MREKLGENGHKRNEAINLQKKDAFVKRDERHSTTIKMSGNYAAVKWRTVEIKKKTVRHPIQSVKHCNLQRSLSWMAKVRVAGQVCCIRQW